MSGWDNRLVGQVGEFLVCAELGRRGLAATPFSGNMPGFDVVAMNEGMQAAPIQVKTARGGSWQFDAQHWMQIELDEAKETQTVLGPTPLADPSLMFVFVWIPARAEEQSVGFFILSAEELQKLVSKAHESWLDRHGGKRPRQWRSTHVAIDQNLLMEHRGRWDRITERRGKNHGS